MLSGLASVKLVPPPAKEPPPYDARSDLLKAIRDGELGGSHGALGSMRRSGEGNVYEGHNQGSVLGSCVKGSTVWLFWDGYL